MSYEVTATRRRPQRFDDLVGQEFVAETLKNSIKSGKIAHAYLFSGPRGCGKTSTARILAKALNCANGPTDTPCGQCSNCQEITKGTSLDVIEIDGASNTSVENIRQIKDEVLFPPSNSRYKIYIIDEVHMLSTSAFNALLKTIEEPPPYVIFIFATTELQKVPATIKSRCQQFNFRLVAIEKVKQCLAEAAAELNIQADEEALFWVARESTGSMRDAYTLFDQVVAFSDGYITYEKIRDKLGLVGIDRLNTIFEACASNKPQEAINILDEFLQGGISIEQLISNCADYLRSLLLIKSGVTKEALLGNSVERYSKLVIDTWNSVQVERALSIYLQLYRDIRYSLSPRYELELSFSRLCWLSQYVSNAEVKKAIDAAQALLAGTAGLTPPASSTPTAATSPAPQQSAPSTAAAPQAPVTSAVQPPAAEATQSVPNGMPRFSSTMMAQIEKSESEPSEIPDGDDSHPFSNGGPLPPEQSVENTEPEQPAPQSLDERLIINIPSLTNQTDDSGAPVKIIPPSPTGYTMNPDEEDDGWSNVDVPPEETYYPDEASAQAFYETYTETPADNNYESAPVQLNDSFTTASGHTISVAQLRGSVKAALEITDQFTAFNLSKTGEWIVKENCVETSVTNNYDLEILKKKIPIIAKEIAAVCEKPMEFKVILKEVQQTEKEEIKIPDQVQMIVNAFKGTIVR